VNRPFILFPFLGAGVGGSHVATFELAQALEAHFDTRCLVLCSEGSTIDQEAQRLGLATAHTGERTAMRHNPFYDLQRLLARLRQLTAFRDRRPIVHCNDLGALQSWAPPAKLLGAPVVYHHHSLNRPALPNRIPLALADAFVCVSEICCDNLSFVPQAKKTMVLNPFSIGPVDPGEEHAKLAGEIGAPDDAQLFGFVGNFWRRKRPMFFLESCRAIYAREKRAHFVVFGRAGDYDERDLVARAKELGVAERVHFMGFRAPAEANIAALDVLMAPAVAEPFGRTLVEAALLGVPYVATADAGHCEIHARWAGGHLVELDASPDQFADFALRASANPSSITLARGRRAEIADEVSARAHAAAMTKVYASLSRRAGAGADAMLMAG
jgi:glycosyltransferase involved in cell wall biosynthesis